MREEGVSDGEQERLEDEDDVEMKKNGMRVGVRE